MTVSALTPEALERRRRMCREYYHAHKDHLRKCVVAWRKLNPGRIKAIKARFWQNHKVRLRQERRAIVNAAKDVPCMDCGKRYPPYVMDFDHRGDKLFYISRPTSHHAIKAIKKEIAKCDVVCSNCHRERTHVRGYTKKGTITLEE